MDRDVLVTRMMYSETWWAWKLREWERQQHRKALRETMLMFLASTLTVLVQVAFHRSGW